jgi:hypothetical protein
MLFIVHKVYQHFKNKRYKQISLLLKSNETRKRVKNIFNYHHHQLRHTIHIDTNKET